MPGRDFGALQHDRGMLRVHAGLCREGLSSDEGSKSGAQIREFLQRAVNAIAALAEECS